LLPAPAGDVFEQFTLNNYLKGLKILDNLFKREEKNLLAFLKNRKNLLPVDLPSGAEGKMSYANAFVSVAVKTSELHHYGTGSIMIWFIYKTYGAAFLQIG
jgi:hypothetical protein